VTAHDEWLAEPYMETDYSLLKKEDFEADIKKYVLFKEMGQVETD
jgi:type I restriction enzyme M protein